jgi:hypothetical protein
VKEAWNIEVYGACMGEQGQPESGESRVPSTDGFEQGLPFGDLVPSSFNGHVVCCRCSS